MNGREVRRMEENHTSRQVLPEQLRATPVGAAGGWLPRAFAWHVRAFVVANAALNVANLLTGRP